MITQIMAPCKLLCDTCHLFFLADPDYESDTCPDCTLDQQMVKTEQRKLYDAERARAYYQANKDKMAKYGKLYRQANKQRIARKSLDYYHRNKDCINEQRRKKRVSPS